MNKKQIRKYTIMTLVCVLYFNLRIHDFLPFAKVSMSDGFFTGFSFTAVCFLLYEAFINNNEDV